MSEEMIDLEEAEREMKRYIRGKVRKNIKDVIFESGMIKEIGGAPVYDFRGTLVVGKFLGSEDKLFEGQVHAYTRKIIGFSMER